MLSDMTATSFEPKKCSQLLGRLTERERQVLARIADGLSYKEVATELGMAFKTACRHQVAIYRKLQVHSAVQATRVFLAANTGAAN